jgi:hypothetical protein
MGHRAWGISHRKRFGFISIAHFPVSKLYIFEDFVKSSPKGQITRAMFVILLSELPSNKCLIAFKNELRRNILF